MSYMKLALGALLVAATAFGADDPAAAVTVLPRNQWISKTFAVEPLARYRLAFRARIDGGPTLENCAEAAEAFYDVQRVARGLAWPRWELRFRTADDRRAKDWGILFPYWNSVASSEWRDYVDVFYAPADAATLQVVFLAPATNATLFATEPTLVKEPGEVLNVNGDFSLGRHCHAGFAMAGYGSSVRMLPRPEGGGFFLRVASWCNMDPVPVVGGRRYKVSIKLRKDTFSGSNNGVSFQSADGKDVKNAGGRVLAKKADLGGEETFRAPKDAVQMRMMVGSADYEWIRVTEVPEEKKEAAK